MQIKDSLCFHRFQLHSSFKVTPPDIELRQFTANKASLGDIVTKKCFHANRGTSASRLAEKNNSFI